jgi:hypothetical protein
VEGDLVAGLFHAAASLGIAESADQIARGFDAQESAVYSAVKVADSLAPSSHTLRSLKARLRASGLADIFYDL